MTTHRMTWTGWSRGPLLAAAVLAALAPLLPASSAPSAADTTTNLVGLFRISAGSCSGGKITGTYLQMILPSGTVNGPYMSNADSPCSDQSFTPLGPGTDGGLSTAGYQPGPSPAFDASGNARANRITASAQYYGTAFATATSPSDPQTNLSVPVPTVTLHGSTLTADLRAFAVSWNRQYFNQGAPKPDGSTPGNTHLATGTYDAATRHFTLDWASQVQGGPFDKFTGKWHLEGTFVPASGAAASGSATTAQAQAKAGSGSAGATQGHAAGQTGVHPAGQSAAETSTPGTAGTAGTAAGSAPPAAGSAPTAAAPVTADPAAAAAAGTGAQALSATAAPAVRTVTQRHQEWRISTPLAAIALAIAALALGAIIGTLVLERRAGAAGRSS